MRTIRAGGGPRKPALRRTPRSAFGRVVDASASQLCSSHGDQGHYQCRGESRSPAADRSGVARPYEPLPLVGRARPRRGRRRSASTCERDSDDLPHHAIARRAVPTSQPSAGCLDWDLPGRRDKLRLSGYRRQARGSGKARLHRTCRSAPALVLGAFGCQYGKRALGCAPRVPRRSHTDQETALEPAGHSGRAV